MQTWGAGRAAWAHFSLVLGLTEDLLPVVSNPAAIVAPGSSLKALGKTPSRYNAAGQVVGIHGWTKHRSTARQVGRWSEINDYGICIQTRNLVAFDIDSEDEAFVALTLDKLRSAAGLLPERYRGNSQRRLLVGAFRGDVAKHVIRHDQGTVELLARGQQFIAVGTHPSGARYEWVAGWPGEIPEINSQQLQDFWQSLGGDLRPTQRRRNVGAVRRDDGGDRRALGDDVADWLERRGWCREPADRSGRLLIHCPWAVDHTGDSGATETVYYLPGGGYEAGHFKCLHAHCAEKTDSDFLDAVGYRESLIDDFPVEGGDRGETGGGAGAAAMPVALSHINNSPVPALAAAGATLPRASPTYASTADWTGAAPGLGLRRKRGRFEAVVENLVPALETPGFWRRLGYDNFRQDIMHCGWGEPLGDEQWLVLTDRDLVSCRLELERERFWPVGRELIRDAVELVAHRGVFDSAQEWLSRQRWDGVPRVDTFLSEYLSAEDSAYTRAVARYMWSAMAGRIITPGVQADMVPILVGIQGIGKTRGVEALVPDPVTQFTSIDLSDRDADLARLARGRLLLELSELRGLHTKDKTAIKSFITQRVDSWIPKYREFSVSAPRRWFAIGTTDADEFLDDEAGERRWLPVGCKIVDVIKLTRDREQLWAEGAALYLADGVAWSAAHELAGPAREQYLMGDAWDVEIADWLKKKENRAEPFTLRDAALGIGLDPRNSNRASEMRLAKILKRLGYAKIRQGWAGRAEVGRKRLWQLK